MRKLTKRIAAMGAAVMMMASVNVMGTSAANWSLRYTTGAPTSANIQSSTLYTYYPSGTSLIRAKCNTLTSNSYVTVSSTTSSGGKASVTFNKVTSTGKGKALTFSRYSVGEKITHKVVLDSSVSGAYTSTGTIYNSYA